jgi:hypothetical protein
MGMAIAPALRLGSAFRASQASRQAWALREVMKTLEQPDWRRLVGCQCRQEMKGEG